MSGERWNLGPRRHRSRCSRVTQQDPEEGGVGSWNSLLGSQLAGLHTLEGDLCGQQLQGRYPMTPLWARHLGPV